MDKFIGFIILQIVYIGLVWSLAFLGIPISAFFFYFGFTVENLNFFYPLNLRRGATYAIFIIVSLVALAEIFHFIFGGQYDI